MAVLAAVDIGSNAMRLVVASVDADRAVTILESVREPVRLGDDVFTHGSVLDATIDRAVEACQRFRQTIDAHDGRWVRAVATSALREAHNAELVVDRIATAASIDVTVISPEEEARLIHLAVASRLDLPRRPVLLVDIGGGSTEITLVRDGQIVSTESYRMGAVRLMRLGSSGAPRGGDGAQLVREYVDSTRRRIKREIGSEQITLLVGTGGNIETLADLRRSVLGKERDGVLGRDDVETLLRRLQGMSLDDRIREFRLRPDRADVIVPAALILRAVMAQADVSEAAVPRVGLKDGLLLDMAEELYGGARPLRREQVVASALQLGRKFQFDEQHAVTVTRHALSLFDALRALHSLGTEHRLLLEVAALLHDIGHFVDPTDHHKHSHYLLTASPLVGLTDEQKAVIANVARYHRKSLPKPQHDAYRVLPAKERVVVSKLAAILRMADALDNQHAGLVTGMTVEHRKPRLLIRVQGDGDILLEKWALLKKADLCEQVFNVNVVVDD
jgi:exopolyphosphatase/guanosine-5'-triphosphate,3'-diphosphate pyrophosphatase